MSTLPYHSAQTREYHNHWCCPAGAKIPPQDRLPVGGELALCPVCESLNALIAATEPPASRTG